MYRVTCADLSNRSVMRLEVEHKDLGLLDPALEAWTHGPEFESLHHISGELDYFIERIQVEEEEEEDPCDSILGWIDILKIELDRLIELTKDDYEEVEPHVEEIIQMSQQVRGWVGEEDFSHAN